MELTSATFKTGIDYEYFDTKTVPASTTMVTTNSFFTSNTSAQNLSNCQAGKVANPFLLKGVRMDMNLVYTTTGLTIQQSIDLVVAMIFSRLVINRGNQTIFDAQTGRFYDSYPIVGEKGTAASAYGVYVQKRIVPLNSDVVIKPNDPIAGILYSPILSGAQSLVTTAAMIGILAQEP